MARPINLRMRFMLLNKVKKVIKNPLLINQKFQNIFLEISLKLKVKYFKKLLL